MKLYVQDEKRLQNDSLYKFLNRVLNIKKNWSVSKVNCTYLDPEFKKIQCFEKYRSFDDITLISKTYFRVSDKAVAKAIVKILNKNKGLCLVLCDSVDKWVINYGLYTHLKLTYCARYNSGYKKINNPRKGKYSYNDILELAGLEREKEQNE